MQFRRADRLVGQWVAHLLPVDRDFLGTVVDDPPLRVVDQHIADVRLFLRGADQRADGVQIEVVQRIGQGVGQLLDGGAAVPAQAVLGHAVHGLAGHARHFLLHRLLPVQQGRQQPDDHRQHDGHGGEEARFQAKT